MPAADPLLPLEGALAVWPGSTCPGTSRAQLLATTHTRTPTVLAVCSPPSGDGGTRRPPHTLPALTDLGVQVTGEC